MLQVERLTKRYGASLASTTCRSACARGRSSACWGPTDSGKSTIVKILTGLIDQTTGHVRLDGHIGAVVHRAHAES